MRITFLRPHMMADRSEDAMEPLAFAVLAGLTPPDVELDFFDERLEEMPLDHDTDLVAITATTYTARRSYQVARHFQRRGIPVVMGGYHTTFLPDEALHYVSSVVRGDAELVWAQVVADARRGRLQRIYQAEHPSALDGLNFDRRIFAGKRYKPIVPVQFGRGCRFACDFCSIHAFYGSHTRYRPVQDVVAEVAALNTRYILFIDDNLVSDRNKAMELFAAITPLRVQWVCQMSIDAARDPALLAAMSRSGCMAALVGFESLSPDNLRQMKKGWMRKHGDYAASIRTFHDHGIMLWGSFVFGYDHDTLDTFERTAEFAAASSMALVNFTAVTPMPGSGLYQRMQREGRLLMPRWWLDPAYRYGQAVFRPASMTPEQLTAGCQQARRLFYSVPSVWRRLWNCRANSRALDRIAAFWQANMIFRRELDRKLGKVLGADESLEPALESTPVA